MDFNEIAACYFEKEPVSYDELHPMEFVISHTRDYLTTV